jgi:hypothetical protein
MTPKRMREQEFQRICLGQPEAMDFLLRWTAYVHAIDDIEDEKTTSEFRLAAFIQAVELYTCPFFLRHSAALKQVVLNCTNIYADSLAWEKSEDKWKRDFSNWARHGGTEMVLAVAAIVGGYAHMRRVSLEIREQNYCTHHGEEGNPK